MKPKFKLENFALPGKYVMCCRTKKEAKAFCKFLDAKGRTWESGGSYLEDNFWKSYEPKILYYFNEGLYSFADPLICEYVILEFSDFDWDEAPSYNKANKYQKAALRTSNASDKREQLINGLMGLNGEAGECIDILKKSMFQGHDLDREHLIEELGDVAWYLAVSADALNVTLSEVFDRNIAKLYKRYPDGFDTEKSVNREE